MSFMDSVYLHKCPFCGGEGKVSRRKVYFQGNKESVAFVYCCNCNARTGYMLNTKHEHYIRDAIDAWNRRADDDK